MKTGLLWYDADPQRGLEDKIGRAAQRYREKYGRLPELCYVNPKTLNGNYDQEMGVPCRLEGAKAPIRVIPARNILLHHFWVGEHGDQAPAAGVKSGR